MRGVVPHGLVGGGWMSERVPSVVVVVVIVIVATIYRRVAVVVMVSLKGMLIHT